MSRTTEFRELIAFTRWANELTLDAVMALSADEVTRDLRNSFPSVRDTLVHVMSAEWVWLSRLEGTSPTAMPEKWRTYDRTQIRAEWTELARRLGDFDARLEDADLDRVVDYRAINGQQYSSTVGQILRHLVNHSTYHRGQVTTMLRQLEGKPVTTDLIHYYRTAAARVPVSQ